MPHYIFVVKGGGREGFEAGEVLRARLAEGRWPVNRRTSHRDRLSGGDRVLFYAAGQGRAAQSFLGTGRLAGPAAKLSGAEQTDPEVLGVARASRTVVPIQTAELFPSPVPIRPLILELDFITSKERWGVHLMGGIVRISKEDFRRIERAAESGTR